MGAVLGLSAAVIFGASDFVGGLAARRLHFRWVALIGQSVGACLVWVSLVWTATGEPSTSALLWGALSGLGTAVGTMALYRGYALGQMAVAGPLSAVGSAALPAVVGVLLGDRLSPAGVAGVVRGDRPAGGRGAARAAGPHAARRARAVRRRGHGDRRELIGARSCTRWDTGTVTQQTRRPHVQRQ